MDRLKNDKAENSIFRGIKSVTAVNLLSRDVKISAEKLDSCEHARTIACQLSGKEQVAQSGNENYKEQSRAEKPIPHIPKSAR